MELKIRKKQISISLWLNGENGNIILAPGLPQYIDKYHPFVRQAERLGLNLFVPKYIGTHESGGEFSLKNSVKTINDTIRLVESGNAIELYAKKRVNWKTKKTVLLGFSYGALPSVLASGDVQRMMICPFLFPDFHVGAGCAGENIVKTLKFLETAYKNIYRINTKYFLRELANLKINSKKERMVFIFGEEDESIPMAEVNKIKQYYKNSDIAFKKGGHSLSIDDNLMIKSCGIKKNYYSVSDFINYTKKLASYNLDKLNSGNFSLRLSKNTFAIKPSGLNYEELTLENISVVNLDGEHLSGLKPSSDLMVHLSIYKKRGDINCIIHTHSHYATVMSSLNANLSVLSTLQADYFGGDIPCIKFINHRKHNIADKILKSKNEVFLLEKHGTFIIDELPEDAIKKTYILEEVAKINFNLKLLKKIKKIKKSDISILNKYYYTKYGNKFGHGR